MAFDAKHNVWLISYLGIKNPSTGPVDVDVSRSTDGGLTWGPPVVVNASGDFNDKNWDDLRLEHGAAPHYGNCYTEFDDFTKLNLFQMSTSTDGGKKWGAAKTNRANTCVIGGQPVVQPNGTVVVPIDDCLETSILSIRSTDGGKSWSNPVLAAQLLNDGHPGNIRSPDLPSAEIDASGRVYVVWTDCRTENFCNSGNNDLCTDHLQRWDHLEPAGAHPDVARPVVLQRVAPIFSFPGWAWTGVRLAITLISRLTTTPSRT